MPLFTFLSGYVLPGREGSQPLVYLRNKALVLLVPYFAWVTVEMLQRKTPPALWGTRLLEASIQPHQGYQMWYLWVLFALFVLFTLARVVSTSDWWIGGLAVAFATAMFFAVPRTAGADKIVWLFPFFVLGYLCGKHRARLRRFDVAWAVGGTMAFAALTWLRPAGVVAQFATAITGISAFWALYRLLPKRLISAQAWIGRKTLGIYGGQMVLLPYLIVGSGWLGVVASETLILIGTTALASLLELTAFTRAAFLGRWPKRRLATPIAEPVEVPAG
jgi:fucose 4-O-acetylase-like acetyltransferase